MSGATRTSDANRCFSLSDADRVIAHQEVWLAKLQEQISTLIVKQDYLHNQLPVRYHQPVEGESRAGSFASRGESQPAVACQSTQQASHKSVTREFGLNGPTHRAGSEIRRAESEVRKAGRRAGSLASTESVQTRADARMDAFKELARPNARLSKAKKELWMPRSSEQDQMAQKLRDVQKGHIKTFTQIGAAWGSREVGPTGQLSRFERAIRSSYFDHMCALMLVTNSLLIGLQVEYSAKHRALNLPTEYVVIDYIYGSWFVIELILRFKAVGIRFFTDPEERSWNLFDCFIVGSSSLEMVFSAFVSSGPLKTLSMVRIVRIARIARMARVIRIMRFFRSLRILLAAIFTTLKSCIWAGILLGIILYMCGIVFVQATTEYRINEASSETSKNLIFYYGTLPRGVFTMFKSVLGGLDWENAVLPLSDVGGAYVAMFVLMITFIYLAVINVISGLFLQTAIETAQSDREDEIRQQLREKERYVQRALNLFTEFDCDHDGQISLAEFEQHLNDKRTIGFLSALEIDITDAWTLFMLLDVDQGGAVGVDEFVEGCLKIRGTAKSLHVAQILYENKWLMDAVNELTNFMDVHFDHIMMQLERLKPLSEQPAHLRDRRDAIVKPPALETPLPLVMPPFDDVQLPPLT